MKALALIPVLMLLAGAVPALPRVAQGAETPLNYHRKISGEHRLPIALAGRALSPKEARLNYRVFNSRAEWKKAWGYLYDQTLEVDFKTHSVLAIYKSPAQGGFEIRATRVYNLEGTLLVDVDVVWNGKTERTHPFLFLVVDRFTGLQVQEKFISPKGRPERHP
jgi:hypothetical protein